jgi:DNA-binding IclR family transcriptional regulator
MSDLTLSLSRFAALLALFARERKPLSSATICVALEAPRSSVAALLKALVELGWLGHDRRSATYLPTARFATLGQWVLEEALLQPALLEAVHGLQAETGETVSLSVPADLALEVVYVTGPDTGIRLVIDVGRRLAIWGTALGTAYLTTVADPTIRSMYRRSEERGERPAVALRTVMNAVRRARENGVAYVESAVIPDVAACSAPLPEGAAPRQLIISVGGPVRRVAEKRAAIQRAIHATLARLDAPRASRRVAARSSHAANR